MMKLLKTVIVLWLVLLTGSAWAAGQAEDSSQLFLQANQAYRQGAYAQAAQWYEQVLAAGPANGHLYYNLGNACLKSDQLGRAILNYKRAARYIPRDEDLRTNLLYARGLTHDKVECPEGLTAVIKRFCFWYSSLNLSELAVAFLIVNALLWLLLVLKMLVKKETLALPVAICAFGTFVLGASFGVKCYGDSFLGEGVVTASEILVRSGNSINDTVLFRLHDGTEFSWEQESDGWVKIRLCDGKKGWVQNSVVEAVSEK
ncbi:MAG: SH3 domain-containing protein [Deltaproteobacteria bacterium]|nr:SH3 domain-containing protein [Deltaproteobacteria bacterium]